MSSSSTCFIKSSRSSSSSSSRYNSFDKQQRSSSDSTTKNHHNDDYYISTTLAKSKSNSNNLSAMVKKFMTSKGGGAGRKDFVVPANFISDDLKKKNKLTNRVSGGLLHNKLFGNKSSSVDDGKKNKTKALTQVKQSPQLNARTLAMVLRSERELLSQNKDQEIEITKLKLMLNDKNKEVDKLKDLCLKQREEIKALKSAILFPDVTSTQLQGLLEKQDSELKQAKQIIPTLQRQITYLTGQLQCLAEDLAEVKADKYSVMGCYDSSPRTPAYEQEEATNSLELSSGDHTTPGSPDDMFLNDLNPCLTPYAKSKSKEFEVKEYHSSMENSSYYNTPRCHEIDFGSHGRKLSKSSTEANSTKPGKFFARRSDENKYTFGKHMHY